MRVKVLSLIALFAAAFAAPMATAPRAVAETVSVTNVSDIVRQEARWVVRRVCRPHRRCFTRYRVIRRPVYRTVCNRYKRGNRWHRRCMRRRVAWRSVRRPHRMCRTYRRCTSRRVWVR